MSDINDPLGLKPTVSIVTIATDSDKRIRIWLNNTKVGHQRPLDL